MPEELLPKPELDLPLPEKELPAKATPALQGETLEGYRTMGMFRNKFSWGFVILSALIAFLIGGFYLGKSQQTPTPLGSPKPTAQAADPTADWKTYTNTKHSYYLLYPKRFAAGYADIAAGEFHPINGNEDVVEFLESIEEEFDNFIQIQVSSLDGLNKNFNELVMENYAVNKNSSKSVSKLEPIDLKDARGYEYKTDIGKIEGGLVYLRTIKWNGRVEKGTYKIIFLEKNGKIYSIYLKDNPLFNQILSTFTFSASKFTEPALSCTPRPSCLDSVPACKMPITEDMCPPNPPPGN